MSQISLSIIMSAEIKISPAPRRHACHEMNLHLLRISEAAGCRGELSRPRNDSSTQLPASSSHWQMGQMG